MADQATGDELHVCVVGTERTAKLVPSELGGRPVVATTCADRASLMRLTAERVPDVVLMEAKHACGDASPLEHVQVRYHDLPVIVVAKDPAVADVVECMKKGAEDVIVAGEGAAELDKKLLEAADKHRLSVQVKQLTEAYERSGKLGELVGISPVMHEIYGTRRS